MNYLSSLCLALLFLGSCTAVNDKEDVKNGAAKEIKNQIPNPEPLTPDKVQISQDGATYSSLDVCTPIYAERISKADGIPRFSKNDEGVTVKISQSDVNATLFEDVDCKTPVSNVLTPSKDSIAVSANYTLKAGATAVAGFVKAEKANDSSSNWADGYLSFEIRATGNVAFREAKTALWFSRNRKSKLPIKVLNSSSLKPVAIGTCTRLVFTIDSGNSGTKDDIAAVPNEDISINISVDGVSNRSNVYRDSLCTEVAKKVVLPAGRQDVSVFILSDQDNDFQVTFSATHGPDNRVLTVRNF